MTGSTTRIALASLVLMLGACSSDKIASPLDRRDIMVARMALTDPNPSAPGYFIPGVSPETCFRNYDNSYPDDDRDWLRDECEFELARAFSPQMNFTNDNCPEWEPYWGAKVFMNGRVRLVYLHAYYKDCGFPWAFGATGHHGDSEMITLDLTFEEMSQHWRLESAWLSAHYKSTIDLHQVGFVLAGDASKGELWDDFYYVDKSRGRPRVWASRNKHANYRNAYQCTKEGYDNCSHSSTDTVTIPVEAARNVGSVYNGRMCEPSVGPMAHTGGVECFYSPKKFDGWYNDPQPDGGAGMYFETLHELFEILSTDNRDPGPGPWRPMPPPPVTNNTPHATIHGPSDVLPGAFCSWYAGSNLQGDLTYQWRVNGNVIGSGQFLSYVFSSPGTFTLEALVTNGSTGIGHNITVTVSEWAGTCAVE